MVHMFQVHKETVESVPGAKSGRDSFDIEIFGMDGVPVEIIAEKRSKVLGVAVNKKAKTMQYINAPEIMIPGTPSVYNQFASHQHGIMVPGMMGAAPQYGLGQSAPFSMPPPPSVLPPPPQLFANMMVPSISQQKPKENSRLEASTTKLEKQQTSMNRTEAVGQRSAQIITPQLSSGGQPFGGYATPQIGMRLPQPVPTTINIPRKVTSTTPATSNNILVYYHDISQEEQRATHPKYSTHLNKRIVSLSCSIEERLKSLGGQEGSGRDGRD